MAIHQIEHTEDYLRFAQKNPAELDALFRDHLIGVALLPVHARDLIAILKLADQALYLAKASGRNCVRLAQPG